MSGYLNLVNGQETYTVGTTISTGAPDANKPIFSNGVGQIDETWFPNGIGADTQVYPASGALAAGDLVEIFDDAGTLKVRKADASNGRPARGFVNVAVADGANATVYTSGKITGLTGLTPGDYFLSHITAGAYSQTAPPTTNNNHIIQKVGYSLTAEIFLFQYQGYKTVAGN